MFRALARGKRTSRRRAAPASAPWLWWLWAHRAGRRLQLLPCTPSKAPQGGSGEVEASGVKGASGGMPRRRCRRAPILAGARHCHMLSERPAHPAMLCWCPAPPIATGARQSSRTDIMRLARATSRRATRSLHRRCARARVFFEYLQPITQRSTSALERRAVRRQSVPRPQAGSSSAHRCVAVGARSRIVLPRITEVRSLWELCRKGTCTRQRLIALTQRHVERAGPSALRYQRWNFVPRGLVAACLGDARGDVQYGGGMAPSAAPVFPLS